MQTVGTEADAGTALGQDVETQVPFISMAVSIEDWEGVVGLSIAWLLQMDQQECGVSE